MSSGALVVNKSPGISSFGVIETIQHQLMTLTGRKKKQLPKMGHGGTLDPFATGVLVVLIGKGVKLARYFLGAEKSYQATLCFGIETASGDLTNPVTSTSPIYPKDLEQLRESALCFANTPYLQTPPMYSAKKHGGKPLYTLARQQIEVKREAKLCNLHHFEFLSYEPPKATFQVKCSSGTYIRTLAQDFAHSLGALATLESLNRTASGSFTLENALTLPEITATLKHYDPICPWEQLSCFVPFHQLLEHLPRLEVTPEQSLALVQGKQHVIGEIVKNSEQIIKKSPLPCRAAVYSDNQLISVLCQDSSSWKIEQVFVN